MEENQASEEDALIAATERDSEPASARVT
jgi:hypothetical protein